jgi:ectoine hydroxylase-related dioxygenase (phytanoyl-CoA dioxygenase family)
MNANFTRKQIIDASYEIKKNGFVILKKHMRSDFINQVSFFLKNCPDANRYTNAGSECSAINLLANDINILKIAEEFFQEKAKAIQTLNFKYGSNQPIHQDTVHFSTFPRDLMLAAWVALEDVGPDQGPLIYIPFSHLLPTFSSYEFPGHGCKIDEKYSRYEIEMSTCIKKLNLDVKILTAEAGDVFLWHPRLWHGGYQHNNSLTRLSQVTHYMACETPIYLKHFSSCSLIPRLQNPKEVTTKKSLYSYGAFSFVSRVLNILMGK